MLGRLLSLCLAVGAMLAASTASAVPCNTLPTMLVVQDRSGSMNDSPTGTTCTGGSSNCSKWQIASSTVPLVLSQYTNQFDYGMLMFPAT